MALQLPNIYTLGQVQVSTQPLAQLQGQLLAKKQAKEEALDKYYNDLTGKITSAGMHSKDIPGFLKEKEDLAKYWNSNKNEISKGGLAKQEFDARANKIFSHVEQSKGDVKFLYDMRDKEIEDEDMPKLAARGRSIYDPAYYKDPNTLTPYDYSDFTHFVPLPDTQKQDALWSSVSRDYKPKVIEYEKDARGNFIYTSRGLGSFTNVYKFTERYADDQILGMADRAAEFVATDKSFRKLYNGILNDAAKATKENKPLDPRFVELKAAYDKFYPGGIMDTPEELAKAAAIVRYKKFLNTGEKDVVDDKAKEKYQSASIISRQKAAGGGQINLSEYPEVPSKGRDITDLMQGVTVFQAPDGTKLSASKVYYDPSTKQINYEALAGRDASGKIVKGEPKVLSLNTFLQNIKTLNPGADFKFVETLGSTRVPGTSKPKGGKKGASGL